MRIATIWEVFKSSRIRQSSQSDPTKLMERILANRLYHIAETTNMFSKLQTGFRKGTSCEDNITRLVQKIMDGFDQKPHA